VRTFPVPDAVAKKQSRRRNGIIGTGISAGKTGGGKGKMQPVCSGGKYPALDDNTPATLSGTDVPVSSGFYGSSDNRSAFEK